MAQTGRRGAVVPADGLLHPVAVVALVLLLVNDHVLKDIWPGPFSGKLSDVAGLVLTPLVLAAGWELACWSLRRRCEPSRSVAALSVAAVGIGFAAAKTLEPAADLYRAGMTLLQWPFATVASLLGSGSVPEPGVVLFVRDPSDLVALPALAVPLVIGQRRIDDAEADRTDQHRDHQQRRQHADLDSG